MSIKPRIVILGAGFGGLWAARELADAPVDIILVDKNNYHTFLPLLYQVAAAELEPERIAQSVRSIVRSQKNLTFRMGTVTAVDSEKKEVIVDEVTLPYDYLLVALGSTTNYFGVTGAEEHCFTLKSVEEAIELRNQILRQVEESAHVDDEHARNEKLTFVIVGGGPTGVEFSGALAELLFQPLEKDFPDLSLKKTARVVLLEASDTLLAGIGGGDYACRRLEQIGVDVYLNSTVEAVTAEKVILAGGREIPSDTVVWTAGVRGVPLLHDAGFETARGGRIAIQPTLQTAKSDRVFVVGDLAYLEQDGAPLPGVAQVAMQQGEHAAQNMMRIINEKPPTEFRYFDKGSMATIGRNAAVTNLNNRIYTGFVAWVLWLAVHIFFLIGFRNRLGVLINWAWNYVFYERVVRLILPGPRP
ncbi:MAG: NAD(P)/FAD-dependent oxidoreductase [Ardenticatenaceae bacterium]|nr:NAD(P)/FAD-dependent oxidoreductase [Ardenticatenaceae bacterium]